MDLVTGDYEIALDYGIKNGPKVKPVTMKFRINNNAPVLTPKQKAAELRADKDDYAKFCRDIFDAIKPVEINLSVDKVKAGAPLAATFTLSKAEDRPFPGEDELGKRFLIIFDFWLHKSGEAKARPGAWRESLFFGPAEIDKLRKEGRLVISYTIETSGLPSGPYEVTATVGKGGEAANAPRPQKQRVSIVK
jgi:hypothetical protein